MSTRVSLVVVAMLSIAATAGPAACQDRPTLRVADEKTSEPLLPGDHWRKLSVGKLTRTAAVHVPVTYDRKVPTPVVLALHGVAMSGPIMAAFSGLNETSDRKGFVVVYPNGTGSGPVLTWNAGGFVKGVSSQADDVGFIRQLLDDLATVVNIDQNRVYACGMSNGAMMCYRLASELSDRIAAIAPVAGTMAIGNREPDRAVSVIHFHGTRDTLVPFETEGIKQMPWLRLKSVEESIRTWAKTNRCDVQPAISDLLSKEGDELTVTRRRYGPGVEGTEVVLVTVTDGGHTWPGQVPPVELLGKSAMNISANELIWAFFQQHPLK
ncbi:alpha/beta hydrolase family esterase [Schlesneria paludicola]|uniref:alpha/beta hydrolase family esterase n=1 Tax=Schlesneria paludicola TaxID=360056 RepID=UPI001ED8DDD3|nr:PHB depolymerase family esterase [Schlesneria paludicola]